MMEFYNTFVRGVCLRPIQLRGMAYKVMKMDVGTGALGINIHIFLLLHLSDNPCFKEVFLNVFDITWNLHMRTLKSPCI